MSMLKDMIVGYNTSVQVIYTGVCAQLYVDDLPN